MAAREAIGAKSSAPPFQGGPLAEGASQQWALRRQKATTLTDQHEPFCEDYVTGQCSSSDLVDSDLVHNDMSCLNAFAPACYPKGFVQSVSDVLNDSVYLHSSCVRGLCPGVTGMVVG